MQYRKYVMIAGVAALVSFFASASEQPSFAVPKEGFKALVVACSEKNKAAMLNLLGTQYEEQLFSGDDVDDQAILAKFVAKCKESARVQGEEGDKAVLLVGFDRWPFPIPMMKNHAGAWVFDTSTGIKEILARRIGRNELKSIEVCKAYVEAQKLYASKDRDDNEVLEYAQYLGSTPGQKDGLYWEAAEGEEQSPFGPMVATAKGEGYESKRPKGEHNAESHSPYHGYHFRILYKQGDNAPGGDYKYIINDHMIGGFALIAYPAEYGNSGVMTFIVNQQGKVYQKDLGEKTLDKAKDIKKYDPDDSWDPADDESAD